MKQSTKIALGVIAIIGWFALVAQFYLEITNIYSKATLSEMIIRYFSYFTITTNLLVAICCTTLALAPASGWGRFFSRQTTLAAITVYIVIVGIIYNTILRSLWSPYGLQKIADDLLHSVIPLLFLVCWLLFAGKDGLRWRNIWSWLLYPLTYIVYVFIRGAASGFIHIPLCDVAQIGLQRAITNAIWIALAFLMVSLLLVAIGRIMHKRKAWQEIIIRQEPCTARSNRETVGFDRAGVPYINRTLRNKTEQFRL